MKTCSKCREFKPLNEFHRNRSRKDGLQHECKACSTGRVRLWREANQERYREGIKRWREANPDKRAIERGRAWREVNRDHVSEYVTRYRTKHPDRYAARYAVNNAVERGDFPPVWSMVCDHCQEAQARDWHHHRGYTEEHRLDVIALCRRCHAKEHANA